MAADDPTAPEPALAGFKYFDRLIPLLARLPLDPATRQAGDEGIPITIRHPESAPAAAFAALARAVMKRLDDLVSSTPLPTIS